MKKEQSEKRGRKAKPSIISKIMKYSDKGKKKYHYIYWFTIHQDVVIDNKWELDIVDLAVFYAIEKFIHYGSPIKMEDSETGIWYWVEEGKILHDMPLLPLASKSAVYKRISNLVKYDLIERNPNNSANRQKHLRLGGNAKLLFYKEYKDSNNEIFNN